MNKLQCTMYNEFDLFNRILNNLVVMVAVIRSAFVGTAVVASVYKESDSFGFSAVTPLLSVLITGLETAAKPFFANRHRKCAAPFCPACPPCGWALYWRVICYFHEQ